MNRSIFALTLLLAACTVPAPRPPLEGARIEPKRHSLLALTASHVYLRMTMYHTR